MAWEEAVYVIKKLSKIIKGTGKFVDYKGTLFALDTPRTYSTVLDIKGRGELSQLFLLGTFQPVISSSSAITYHWSYKITIDGVVVTPDNDDVFSWHVTNAALGRYSSLPLVSLAPSGSSSYNAPRSTYLTSSSDMPTIADGIPLKFQESCKVELYSGTSTISNKQVYAICRASYVER